ncbi:hypothetical protein Tco_0799579 [Tanacetum coccineum]|uniref:Uncharacterized protein n=1 Tax=Tanacetum coccineum TaxID=301880 RepID=A0ABQ4ZTD4_9ASTR
MKINTPYPENSIRRIQRTQYAVFKIWNKYNILEDINVVPTPRNPQYASIFEDDPNLTMEEYIRLEEEKAHKREKVFNWQTATYGKIRVDDDLHNFSFVEAEFPAIVINDAVAPQDEIQCKSQVGGARKSNDWRQFILALGLHMEEEMQMAGFGVYWAESTRQIPNKGEDRIRSRHRGEAEVIAGGKYLRLFAARRKSRAHISGGQFVARLAEHFGLLTVEILGGLTAIALELPIIHMTELVRLQICAQFDDTWAWVAMGPERQPVAAAGVPAVAEDVLIIDEGG